ncbi:MAG TPA: alpha/beta hydrolase [Acidimicrobiia bacterium]|nr:alpha/beta hydrolase [Acidimicrobiia bacterium]
MLASWSAAAIGLRRTDAVALPLNTISWGDGPRKALLLHGASSSAEVWWRLGPDLAGLGFTAVAADLRGHGLSPRNGEWTESDYRSDVLAMGGDWDVVAGHSFGGLLAVTAQAEAQDFAGALVLEDPALRYRVTDEFLGWLEEEFAEPITVERMRAARPEWDPQDVETKVRALNAVGFQAIRDTFTSTGDIDAWATFGGLTVPRLLLAADPRKDALVAAEDVAAARLLEGVEAMTIAGSSHSIHRDSYGAFWQATRDFVERHVP